MVYAGQELMRLLVLSVALVPYLGFIAIDAWMHEKARRVPRVEQWLHGGIALAIGAFFLTVFVGADAIAGQNHDAGLISLHVQFPVF